MLGGWLGGGLKLLIVARLCTDDALVLTGLDRLLNVVDKDKHQVRRHLCVHLFGLEQNLQQLPNELLRYKTHACSTVPPGDTPAGCC